MNMQQTEDVGIESIQKFSTGKIQNQLDLLRTINREEDPRFPLWVSFVLAPLTSVVVFYIAFYANGSPNTNDNFGAPWHFLFKTDVTAVQQSLGTSMRSLANLFTILFTISAMIIQLASNRYTTSIRRIFFSTRWVSLTMGFVLVTLIFGYFEYYSTGLDYLNQVGGIITLIFVLLNFILMYPYFYFLLNWLDPSKIVDRLLQDAIQSHKMKTTASQKEIEYKQKCCVRLIDLLSDLARRETEARSKNVSFLVVDSLITFCYEYVETKHLKPSHWYTITPEILQTPDFISLSSPMIESLEKYRVWIEYKIQRQFLSLYRTGLHRGTKDICFLVVTHTRSLAVQAMKSLDLQLLDLCIKFFNTYLRESIHSKDARVAFTTMDEYRKLCELILSLASFIKFGNNEHLHKGSKGCEQDSNNKKADTEQQNKERTNNNGNGKNGNNNNNGKTHQHNCDFGGLEQGIGHPTNERQHSLFSEIIEKYCKKIFGKQDKINHLLNPKENGKDLWKLHIRDHKLQSDLENRVLRIVRTYWLYYFDMAVVKNLISSFDTISHDIATILDISFNLKSDIHDEMFNTFARLNKDNFESVDYPRTLGLLKAKVKLASSYLVYGQLENARKLMESLKNKASPILQRVREDIENDDEHDFWEINDRGINYNYLSKKQKETLETLFSWI